MAVTYRFNIEADRSDGKKVLVLRAAAVYNTVEEALLQAGADAHMGASPTPVDVIDGAHHGYEVTAHGEPVEQTGYVDRGLEPQWLAARRKAAEAFKAKVIADGKVIERAAEIVRKHMHVHPDDPIDNDMGYGMRAVVVEQGDKTLNDAAARANRNMMDELRGLVS